MTISQNYHGSLKNYRYVGGVSIPATEKTSSKVDSSFKPTYDTKKIKLTEDDPTNEAIIGAGLDEK